MLNGGIHVTDKQLPLAEPLMMNPCKHILIDLIFFSITIILYLKKTFLWRLNEMVLFTDH